MMTYLILYVGFCVAMVLFGAYSTRKSRLEYERLMDKRRDPANEPTLNYLKAE